MAGIDNNDMVFINYRLQRIASLFDQGIWSVVNFVHVWLVAYYTSSDSLSSYIISFSFCLLSTRIHSALVAMPLATECGMDNTNRGNIFRNYNAINDKLIALLILSGLIFAFTTTHITPTWIISSSSIVMISIAAGCVMLNEHIRRILLICGHPRQLLMFDLIISLLTCIGIFTAIKARMHGEFILSGFLLPGLSALLAYIALRRKNPSTIRGPNNGRFQFRKNLPLLVNNLAQWATGQSAYFLTALLLSSKEVAILAILRNLFGPLNILILSLEGVLPKTMSVSLSMGGIQSLMDAVKRELLIATLIFFTFSICVVLFGSTVAKFAYGNAKAESIEIIYLVGIALVYGFSVLGRILTIALRTQSNISSLGNIALIGLTIFLISGWALANMLGIGGIIIAMVITEGCIFGKLFIQFSKGYG